MRSRFSTSLATISLGMVLTLSLVACGGTSGGSSSTDDGGSTSGGGSNLTFTGAVQGTVTDKGFCSGDTEPFKAIWTKTISGKLYLFQIVLTHFKGAGTYTTGSEEGEPTFDLTDQSSGNGWHTQYSDQESTIVLNADQKSGTVTAFLASHDGQPETQVSGTWACGS